MLWSRKTAPAVHDRSRFVGLDLTSSRVRGVSVGSGKQRTLHLDGTAEELRLFVHLDARPSQVGRAGFAIARKLPHSLCSGFLPLLGHPRTWPAGRHDLTADDALGLAFDKIRGPVIADSDAAAVVLPSYLTAPQVAKLVEAAAKAKLPLKGTAVAALAVAAHRSRMILGGPDDDAVPVGSLKRDSGPVPVVGPASDGDWVVPIRPDEPGPGGVVVIDADESALTATAVALEDGEARLVGSAAWPKLAWKLWMDRLVDAVADRCVRVCRRDPRDSADAEQALFEQLPDALDLSAQGHAVTVAVRAAHWFQELTHRPADLEGYCSGLAKQASEGVRELVGSVGLPAPPKAVWLTAAAGRLPGLAGSVYRNSFVRTAVDTLPENAVAEAAAALAARWQTGELPRSHLDSVIPLAKQERGAKIEEREEEAPYARRAPTRSGG
jgi:hypothetical protein